MLIGTTTTVTGLPRVRLPDFQRAVQRRASRGTQVAVVQLSVVAREGGEVVVLAHWRLHNPNPSEAHERADEVVWRSLIDIKTTDVEVSTQIDPR